MAGKPPWGSECVVGPGGPSDISLINDLVRGLGNFAVTDIQDLLERPPKPFWVRGSFVG
jgi:hypothetical protein